MTRQGERPADPRWLDWAKRLQAIAQDGLTYTGDPFDVDRYRSLRGIAAEIAAEGADADVGPVLDLFAGQTGPATPKVDVRAAAFRGEKILLVREPEDGGWSPPGGWADAGETPGEAVVREVREESGYRARAIRLLAAYDRDRQGHTPLPYYVYKLIFLCELEDEDPSPEVDSDGVAFFGEGEIPGLSISRVTPAQIRRFFEHHKNPNLPADFD